MNASRLPESPEPDERPALEPLPGPVAHQHVERRWFGLPARVVLLCLTCAAFGAAIGLFASGNWAWGVVAVLLGALFVAVLSEGVRQRGGLLPEQSTRLAVDGRAHAATAAEIWRTRLDTAFARWRVHTRLDGLDHERRAAVQALGEAVYREDPAAEETARRQLADIDERRRALEEELDRRVSGAEERIRLARLPVQETLMVSPNEPSAPYPPPDEGEPAQPAIVPEPYPPPDEGTPPQPAPDPGTNDD